MRAYKFVWIVCIFSFFICFSNFSLAADVAKIGVVDTQKVMVTSNAGKAILTELRAKGEIMDTDLKKKLAEMEELRKRLERESMVMSKEMREEKEREQRIKFNDLKSLEKRYRTELGKLEAKLVPPLKRDIIAITQEIGKKGGYLLILNNPNVIYAPTSVDLTDKVIQALNKKSAKAKK